jgi:hypothetical protein
MAFIKIGTTLFPTLRQRAIANFIEARFWGVRIQVTCPRSRQYVHVTEGTDGTAACPLAFSAQRNEADAGFPDMAWEVNVTLVARQAWGAKHVARLGEERVLAPRLGIDNDELMALGHA